MDFLEKITPLFALLSTASLLASIVFNIGYFSYLGIEFLFFLSLADHFVAAVLWAPTVVFIAVGLYMAAFSMDILRHTQVSFQNESGAQRLFLGVLRNWPIVVGAVSFVLAGLVSSSVYGQQYLSLLAIGSVLMIIFLLARAWLHKAGVGFRVPTVPVLLATLVFLGLCLFGLGQYWGSNDLSRAIEKPAQISMKSSEIRTLGIVRVLSGAMIVVDQSKRSKELISLDEVHRVTVNDQIDENGGKPIKGTLEKIALFLSEVFGKAR